MKKVLDSILISLSMYTTVPVKNIVWNNDSTKYLFYVFPFVTGLLIGVFEALLLYVSKYYGVNDFLYAGLSLAVIVLLTGGIHFDGYADTIDAAASHGDWDKKRQILADSRAGAFAVIYTVLYFIILYSCFITIYKYEKSIYFLLVLFVISRFAAVYLISSVEPAVKKGLLYTLTQSKNKISLKIYSLIFIILFCLSGIFIFGCKIILMIMLLLVVISIILKEYFNKSFGGISGDLAGFSICIYELLMLILYGIFGI